MQILFIWCFSWSKWALKYDLWLAWNIPTDLLPGPHLGAGDGWLRRTNDHGFPPNTITSCFSYIEREEDWFGTWNLTIWVHLLQLLLPTVMFPPFSSDHWSMISSPVSPLSMFSECGVPVSRHQEMMTCGYQDHPPHPSDYPQPGPILPGLTFISHLGLGFYPQWSVVFCGIWKWPYESCTSSV